MFSYTSQLTKMLTRLHFVLCISIAVFLNSTSYSKCNEKPVIVAVIDTGFGYSNHGQEAKLCSAGHKDFSPGNLYASIAKQFVPLDTHGHGTNIVGIIEQYAKEAKVNYCILVLKYFSQSSTNNMDATVESFRQAMRMGATYINYSSGGNDSSFFEKQEVEKFLESGGTLVVSAGNEGLNLDLPDNNYYPAEYDKRIIVVGMLEKDGVKSNSSNYGSAVNRWEIGRNVTGYQITQSGTSQATAVAMGKILAQNKNKCDIGK